MALGAAGIFFFHYREMTKPFPPVASLRQIPADGMRYELGGHSQRGFEFFGPDGKRYQTGYMDKEEAMAIEKELQQGGVILAVGPWKSALESDSIFTVYHMTKGEKVLMDYNQLAIAKEKEQKMALPVIGLSALLIAGAFALVRKKRIIG
jgi:hypothetical protein